MAQPPESQSEDGTQNSRKGGWFSSKRARPSVGEAVSATPAPPPPRKTRRTGLIGLFSGLMTVALIAATVGISLFAIAQRDFSHSGPLTADRTVLIEKGTSADEIAEQLTREGVISKSGWFLTALLFRDFQSKFSTDEANKKNAKAGEYLFRANSSMNEVLDIITSGRSVQHVITIPEGLTSEQIVERLKENDLLVGDVATIPVEGSLLPDTYRINRGTPRAALLARMEREQKKLLTEIWQRRSKELPFRSPRDLVTMASIVEKETGRADERPRVAGVFVNRLEKKMRLQSDPTIIYGLVGGKGTLGRGITRAEIDKPTPYNTYAINGLPPGPIANPGRAAMEATANPSKVKDLFFVADGTGGHVFAETLEQHNRNVARWRQIEAARSKDAPATPDVIVPGLEPAAPSGNRGALEAPAQRLTPGFSAPARTTDSAVAPAPPPEREAVGSIAPRPNASPRVPLRTTNPAPDRSYDLTTPKVVPSLQ